VRYVFVENPILRSHMIKAQALEKLAVPAGADAPLLHGCGSRDPELDGQPPLRPYLLPAPSSCSTHAAP
jgi:hypothetical protein